ncbi:Intersectin-2 [Dinochytrium kinnereticum]|nr:Intersectin-2 [Dinochytrium kinnereticum]
MDIDQLTCSPPRHNEPSELTKVCVRSKSSFALSLLSEDFFTVSDKRQLAVGSNPSLAGNKVEEESLARTIERLGFNFLWSHALARIETQRYRHSFLSLSSMARKATAHKIYITFLCRNATSPLPLRSTLGADALIESVRRNIENPEASLFDMLSFVCLQEMQDTFNGEGRAQDLAPASDTREERGSPENAVNFRNSAFFQALRNDTKGGKNITLGHLNRAAERLLDMTSGLYPVDSDSLISVLEGTGLDCESYRARLSLSSSVGGLHRTTSRRVHGHTLRAKSLSSVSERRKTIDDGSAFDLENIRHAYSASSELSPHSHAFIAYIENDNKFCEYCFRAFKENEESKRSKRLTDKINSIQKDIEIESKIMEGITKINSAKVALTAKSKRRSEIIPTEISQQVDFSSRKLEALQQELHRCRLQLAAISANTTSLNPSSPIHNSSESMKTADDGTSDEEVVKVTVLDGSLKTELRGAFIISPKTTTCHQLITSTIAKFRLQGAEYDYNITYINALGDELPLRYEDLLSNVDSSFSNGGFRVAPKMSKSMNTQGPVNEESLQLKQKEVIREITETEKSYVDDLKIIIQVFVLPLSKSGILKTSQMSEIFANIESISVLHEGIAKKMAEMKDDAASLVKSTVRVFEENVVIDYFAVYNEYCANQNSARRCILRLRNDSAFQKFIAQCEANPKLHKLALADFLVKPMHRITRYPIFFKRLLSLIPKTNPDFDVLNDLISKIELRVSSVNEAVRKQESSSKLLLVEENIDFANICEKFKIANGKRDLIMERQFNYHKKNASTPTEVTLLLMSDMILITRLRKEQYTLYRSPIPLEYCLFVEKSNVTGLAYAFQIIHSNVEQHTLVPINPHERETWLHEAETARSTLCLRLLESERRLAEKLYNTQLDSIHASFPASFSSQDASHDVTVKRALSWGHRSLSGDVSPAPNSVVPDNCLSSTSSMKRRAKSVEVNLGIETTSLKKTDLATTPKKSGHPGIRGVFSFSSRRNDVHPKTPPTPKTPQNGRRLSGEKSKSSEWVSSGPKVSDMVLDNEHSGDLSRLVQWWVMERTTSDILPYQNELLENIMELLSAQVCLIICHALGADPRMKEGNQSITEESEAFVRSIYEQEIERVKFVVRSYLRTRISKIEEYYSAFLRNQDMRSKLAPHEESFAERFQELLEDHYNRSFMSALPPMMQSLESAKEPGIVQYPDMNKPVFCLVKKDIGIFSFKEGYA